MPRRRHGKKPRRAVRRGPPRSSPRLGQETDAAALWLSGTANREEALRLAQRLNQATVIEQRRDESRFRHK